jgi:protein-S-isoprenylcysteine O-methyltransferase Ste14
MIREACYRMAAVVSSGYFAARAAGAYAADPWRISLLALLLCESLTLVLLIFSAIPKQRDWRPAAVVASWFCCIYPVLVDVAPGVALAPWQITGVLSALGLCLNMWAKLNLGASFAILPGVRTVVASGPYRFIRHPIYAGYFLTGISFLLIDYSRGNLFLLSTVFACEFYRVGREEALLRQEPAYRAYCDRVRHRFIPGIV